MDFLSLGAFDLGTFCTSMKGLIVIIGWVLYIFKIAIPLLIIAYGIFDFGKAVIAEKEDEIKKQTKRLIFRVVAGVAVFFIPSIITFLFTTFVSDYDASEFTTCETCFLHPNQCN